MLCYAYEELKTPFLRCYGLENHGSSAVARNGKLKSGRYFVLQEAKCEQKVCDHYNMGNGAAVPSKDARQIAPGEKDHTTVGTKRQTIAGLARLAKAKSKFINTKGRREALKASKRVGKL